MPSLTTIYSPGLGQLGTLARYERLLLAKLRLSPTDVWVDKDDYFKNNANPWLEQVAGTGAASGRFELPGGYFQLASGATAASSIAQWGGGTVSNTKTKKWGIVARFRTTTAVDAQSKWGIGIRDGSGANQSVMIGSFGGLSTTHYVLQHDGDLTGSGLSTGVALDTNTDHIFLVYCLGDNVYRISTDGGAELTVTPTAPVVNNPSLFRYVQNGTTAAARTLFLDWHVALGERA